MPSDDAPVRVFPANSNPIGIGFDGANNWVSNYDTTKVTKLRGSDGSIVRIFTVGGIDFAFYGAKI